MSFREYPAFMLTTRHVADNRNVSVHVVNRKPHIRVDDAGESSLAGIASAIPSHQFEKDLSR